MSQGALAPMAERLAIVRDRIDRAAREAGRASDSVQLIAVSKTKPAESVREAYALGIRDFGENYVQELVTKAGELSDLTDVRWHAIGHVQTNKAREVARVAHAVHAVDSAKLAAELGRRAATEGRTVRCLVQVNVGGEVQKSGCAPDDVTPVLEAIEAQASLSLRGLMTVPPHTDDPAGARPYFEALASLRDRHGGLVRLPELSMGMTHDLEVAVLCGATMVRVGSALFGERA